ncbi:WD40-like Beta Propeller Repeat [Mariprofundus ferrinatatus]|uniref:WD40-like Beta Propeller Repeat n=1 Tax=Mariprofundus ferrinatatus TaxID=1921087 RepID=A0A2K8L322_9PROT|nr:PD40 domain-containing protein [Mariprofundus ferrinatatus]ATX81653.1 WD40-like Beta Propeller Repeat [Mariprofundus ferrinatatus]
MKLRYLLSGVIIAATLIQPSLAISRSMNAASEPLYPVTPYIAEKSVDTVYPSVAGEFLVFGQVKREGFSIHRTSKSSPSTSQYKLKKLALVDDMRYGVAVKDGSVGYVSNRVGPISAWMWQGRGDGQVAIVSQATYSGGLTPYHLNASPDGRVWCFDSTYQKLRYNQMFAEFIKFGHYELIGQQWRTYDSDSFRKKSAYMATKTGNNNKFDPPVLYTFQRNNSQLVMIPNAFDGAISPDGKKVAFVRETDGNYDIWMQDIDGSDLMQLTSSQYGDFEPTWSPDGRKLAFVSNRDSGGDVLLTSIYVLDISTNRITRLTNSSVATDGGPAWFDDNSILFHSNRSLDRDNGKGSTWNIWKLDIK